MTQIQSKTAQVGKSAQDLFNQLMDFQNFEKVMPDSVTKFEADGNSFKFAMRGVPEVRLVLDESEEFSMIKLKSGSSKIDFNLLAHISSTGDNTCDVKFEFTGNFNPMLRMMIERPLKAFIEDLADKIASL